MMGSQGAGQAPLFYAFNLEDHIPGEHLKRIMKLDRLRLRGLNGARDEFLMAAAVQNLRRMAKWLTPKAENRSPVPV